VPHWRLSCRVCEPVVPRETNGHLLCEQHLFGNPAKVPEGALDTGKPTLLALVAKRPDIKPPREQPSVATNRYTFTFSSPIVTRRSPKSICSCLPGGVSKRTVASASAFSWISSLARAAGSAGPRRTGPPSMLKTHGSA
jgi:hypothetical protein